MFEVIARMPKAMAVLAEIEVWAQSVNCLPAFMLMQSAREGKTRIGVDMTGTNRKCYDTSWVIAPDHTDEVTAYAIAGMKTKIITCYYLVKHGCWTWPDDDKRRNESGNVPPITQACQDEINAVLYPTERTNASTSGSPDPHPAGGS